MSEFMRAVRELNITVVQLNVWNLRTYQMDVRRFDTEDD
jgi:hypothetical protein